MDTAEINEFRKLYDRVKGLSYAISDAQKLYLDNSERSRSVLALLNAASRSLGGTLDDISTAEREAKKDKSSEERLTAGLGRKKR